MSPKKVSKAELISTKTSPTMAGITHYSTGTKGIGGRIKRRISDFMVKEITIDGKTYENKAFGKWPEKREQELIIPENTEEKEQLHVTLEKFNMDTSNVTRMISRTLRTSPRRIGYGGMKDKRGITTQRISIWKPDLELLKKFHSRYVSLTDAEWRDEKIEIGSLIGNEFIITVRDVELAEKELRKTVEACLKEMQKGVVNYFGEQRFGGIRMVTHRVGKLFVEGKMKEAVMLYLTSPAEGEEAEIAAARKELAETGNFADATKKYPPKFRYERAIIHHLCKYPNDFVGAFQKLPKHLTYLFTHAYQSYIFNELINRRIELGVGFEPIEGDVLEDGIPTAGLLGFDSKFPEGKQGELEREILEKEGITLEDFRVKGFAELGCAGLRKKMIIVPKNMKIVEIAEDEENPGKRKITFSFSLDKGNYATTILREIMKSG